MSSACPQLPSASTVRNKNWLFKFFLLHFHPLVSTADVVTFKDLVKMRKIPSKERVVALKGVPREHSEKHIRALFNGKQKNFILI